MFSSFNLYCLAFALGYIHSMCLHSYHFASSGLHHHTPQLYLQSIMFHPLATLKIQCIFL
jgi:hypothetical protein